MTTGIIIGAVAVIGLIAIVVLPIILRLIRKGSAIG